MAQSFASNLLSRLTEGPGQRRSEPLPAKSSCHSRRMAVSSTLRRQFQAALARVEAAMMKKGWIDKEALEAQE